MPFKSDAKIANLAQLISTNPDTCVDAICQGKPCVLAGGGALIAPLQLAAGV